MASPMRPGRCSALGRPACVSGFAYVLLLVLVATLGILAAGSVSYGHQIARRHAEQELLAIGEEFRAALRSYGAGMVERPAIGPLELTDLLRDPRVAGVRRHLRQIYTDPMTGKAEWGLVRGAGNRILGIYSLAPGTPLKQVGFEEGQEGFDAATSYAQWVFSIGVLPSSVQRSRLNEQ